jgi:hypothetical protein
MNPPSVQIGEAQPPIPTFANGGHLKSGRSVRDAFSLEVSGFSQCFQEPFRHIAAFWAIENHYGISLCRNGDYHLSVHSLQLSNCGTQVSPLDTPLARLVTADP